jgi:excisionase family DNA binding protein
MRDVLTLEEIAEYLRVHPTTIYRLLKKQQIPAFKVGSDWRFNLVSIDRWRASLERAHNNDERGSSSGARSAEAINRIARR